MKKIIIAFIITISFLINTTPIKAQNKNNKELTKEQLEIRENNKSGLIIITISTLSIIIITTIYKKKKIKF